MRTAVALLSFAIFSTATVAAAADWTPEKWSAEETLEFRSECPDEGEHWSYVWLVLLDGNAWVRLGSQAAGRVDCSSTKPLTSIRIAGEQFDDIELVAAADMTERVAAAMGEKYWSDVFVRWFHHPYTMKLVPKEK